MTEPSQIKPARAHRILLVDDDTAFTAFFKEFLLTHRPGAWVVHTADNYAPALACLKEHAVDLVVLDIKMPIMDGLQLLTLLKRTHPELQVVILTSSATPEYRAQSLQNGAALFFDKTEIAGGLEKIYAALENVASAPAEGFRGMLRQVGLPDVLQMECLGRKSSVLEVTSPKASGRIFISDGSIIHAEMGTTQGEPALFQLLALGGGEFLLKPFAKPARQTIDAHWESLLMEAARLFDEAAAGATTSEPAAATPDTIAPGVQPAAAPAQPVPSDRRIREIVLCSNTGELFYEWQSADIEHRIQLLNLILKISTSLAQSLALARADRLEIETRDDRIVVLLQQDRRLFVRSGAGAGTL
jgi:DNA-binding NarL/FixJ family response regulator